MSNAKNIYVPISDDSKHPIFIGLEHNALMNAWDICLLVGNFKATKDAQNFADQLAEFMRGFEGAVLDKPQ